MKDGKTKKVSGTFSEKGLRRRLRTEKADRMRTKEQEVQTAMQRRNPRNIKEAIKIIFDGKGDTLDIPNTSPLRRIKEMYNDGFLRYSDDTRKILLKLLLHCEEQHHAFWRAKDSPRFAGALIEIGKKHRYWIRDVEAWIPTSHNPRRQLGSLLRHLFAKYDVPVFMDSAWLNTNTDHQEWFIHIGQGKNIRTVKGLPVVLTKKEAHYFLLAPNDFDPLSAIRWGQIHALGGDERTVRTLLASRIGTDFTNNEFWMSVIRWFIQNTMLDTVHWAPIIDYIFNQKFVATVPNPGPGPRLVPTQPGLTMKGRTADTLIKQVQDWHQRLGKERRNKGDKTWHPCGVTPFYHEEGDGANKNIYTIEELLEDRDLREEGNAMKHCVASYAYSCSSGRTSIWSMKRYSHKDGTTQRMLTIEVDNREKKITQARGKFNVKPDYKAQDIMNRWLQQAKLSMSRWVI